MKLLQVTPRYYPDIGGVEEHVRNISERLAKHWDVSVFATDPSGKLPKEETISGVKVRRFKSWAPNEAYYFSRGLKKYLMKNSDSFDIVHAHNYHAFPALYAAWAKKSNRLVFTSHYFSKGATAFRTLLHIPYKFIARKILQKADTIICVSNYEKTLLMSNFKIGPEKVTVIPHGVSLKDFKGLQKKKKRNRSRIILYVGRLVKYKGVHHLIEALPSLDKSIRLQIVGNGPYYKNLVRLTSQLAVKDRVVFCGGGLSKGEIVQKYVDADLFVLLSKYEGYAISVAEALASGTPCIVANISALTEWIDNKNCFGINYPINIHELVDVVTHTIGKTVEGTKLCDWDEIAERLVKTYVR